MTSFCPCSRRARDKMQRERPGVIFYDRGLLDMKACAPSPLQQWTPPHPFYVHSQRAPATCSHTRRYLSGTQWDKLLSMLGMTEEQVHARYDLVIHLETAAIGAEKYYTVENNAARKEGIEARGFRLGPRRATGLCFGDRRDVLLRVVVSRC